MKIWDKPQILNLSIESTYTLYENECNWNEAVNLGLGNEDYTNPNKKPAQHPDWVWCKLHGRWHPKDHTEYGSESGSGSGSESIIPGIS